LRGQSVDLPDKCRRFRPPEQWKRFAFSIPAMEAYFRKRQSQSGFVLSALQAPAQGP
jgi:hypothetical protein